MTSQRHHWRHNYTESSRTDCTYLLKSRRCNTVKQPIQCAGKTLQLHRAACQLVSILCTCITQHDVAGVHQHRNADVQQTAGVALSGHQCNMQWHPLQQANSPQIRHHWSFQSQQTHQATSRIISNACSCRRRQWQRRPLRQQQQACRAATVQQHEGTVQAADEVHPGKSA